MRGDFEEILKENMRELAIITRDRLDITQAEMAELMLAPDASVGKAEK